MVLFNINVTVNPARAASGIRTVDRGLRGLETSAGRLRRALGGAFALLAGGALLTASVRTLASFGQEMSTVAAITQATGREFELLRERAIQLGTETRFTSTQAAEGLTFLARAGFDVSESFETIDDTLALAQAGALGLGRAADITSNVLRGFRLETSEAGRVVDVLALAANSSNTTVEQLGDALKFVGPIAAGVGLSLENTVAAVSELSNAGLQATLAGTGLRRVISELESPSAKTRGEIAKLNSDIDRGEISTLGLFGALQKLTEAGVDTGRALEIFGDRGGPAFEVLSGGSEAAAELAEELRNAGGTADRIADIMDDNLNGSLLALKSSFEGLILRAGDSGFTSTLRFLVDGLTAVFRVAADFVGPTIEVLSELFSGLAESVGFATDDFKNFADSSPEELRSSVVDALNIAAQAADQTLGLFKGIGDAIFETVRNIPRVLGDLFFSAVNGIIFAFETALDITGATFDTIKKSSVDVGNALLLFFQTIGAAAGQLISGNVDAALETAELATFIFGGQLATTARDIPKVFGEAFDERAADSFGTQLENKFSGAVEGLGGAVSTAFLDGLNVTLVRDTLDEIEERAERARSERAAAPESSSGTPGGALSPDPAAAATESFNAATDAATTYGEALEKLNFATQDYSGQALKGLERGLANIVNEITDVAGATNDLLVGAFNNAEDALVEFALTGEADFSALVDSIIADIARLIIRLLLLKAIEAAGGAGSAIAGFFGGQRQGGGSVNPREAFLVGENGPELFTPPTAGRIVPAGETADRLRRESQPPVVNVTAPPATVNVYNVQDPREVPNGVESPEGEQAVLNVLRRKRIEAKGILG